MTIEGKPQSGNADTGPLPDWEALARHLSGESSEEESARIEAAFAAYPEDTRLLVALDRAMAAMSHDIPMDLDVEGALSRVKSRMSGEPSSIPSRTQQPSHER